MQQIKKNNERYEDLWSKIKTIRKSWREPETLIKLIDEWDNEYGSKMDKIAEKIIADKIRHTWAKYASKNNISTLEDFINSAWEGWTEGEFTLTRSKKGVEIHCTKYPHCNEKSIHNVLFRLIYNFRL